MDLDNVVGKSKTLIKFDAWFFLMNLENQEESFSGFFYIAFITFFILFFTFLHRFYILHKPTTIIFKRDG